MRGTEKTLAEKCDVCGRETDRWILCEAEVDGKRKSARMCMSCHMEWSEARRVERRGTIAKYAEFWKNFKEGK
jgi:hypothetical protein